MPTLDWIGKKAVVEHHRAVPFHLLRESSELSIGDPGSGNLLVQGDNLLALKALLPYYAGQVKCIYIDPPYNTGNEGWSYNDNVKAPEIQRWLGEVVGKEAEDLSRHDKWLCMMYPRLMLLKEFLREDGAIFVSIDDAEVAHLRLLMDEVFGYRNFVACIIWEKADSPRNSARQFSTDHDYLLVYSRNPSWVPRRLPRTEEANAIYSNPDNDPRGPWLPGDPYANKPYSRGRFTIVGPTGRTFEPPPGRYWRTSEERIRELDADGRIWWGPTGDARPSIKRYLSEVSDLVPRTMWGKTEVGSNRTSKNEMRALFPGESSFDTPKPTRLIRRVLEIATGPGDLVLDSFAGSGTTGHAVMQLNSENPDAQPRRFILCEMEPQIAREVTAKRLHRVSKGYGNTPGTADGFRFCELGPTLFHSTGRIRPDVTFEELARHVYFVETGEPLPDAALNGTPLLGVSNGTAVYLLYNGILKDRSPGGGNALTRDVLEALPPHEGPRVVYGASRRVSPESLRRAGVVFRQTPYEIRTR